MPPRLAIIGEYSADNPTHAATNAAIAHSTAALGIELLSEWISSADADGSLLGRFDGLWIAPGSPYKDMAGALAAIRFAREQNVPCLGTCGGFQHMIIEYARNVLGFPDAQHAEYDPYASDLFVTRLACSLVGQQLELRFAANSLVADCYGSLSAVEQYYCNFGVSPERAATIASGPLRIVGSDSKGEIRVVELPGHPFFVGTLFVPQARSLPGAPHPLVTRFLQAVANRRAQSRSTSPGRRT
jgi:CTP synthase (UTP-ammonia lyase)